VLRFILRRLAWTAVVLWIVFTSTFFLMRAVPGGPFSSERALDPDIKKNFEARYDLDKPILVQYGLELKRYLTGELGLSMKLRDFTINDIIGQGFPVSAALGLSALLLALSIGVSAGIISAVRRGKAIDVAAMGLATVGVAVPEFVVAGLAILAFVFWLPLFPAAGWGTLRQLVLPATCLALPYAAYVARLTRTGMLDVLSQDYIRTARAKGLKSSTVIIRHALKGALLPVVSYLGPATAGIMTGSLIEEKIFAIPGLGVHLIESVTQRDYTLAMALTMLYTVLLCGMSTLVDFVYTILDPRIKLNA
jgi:oligopeptide transport system permease protein